MRFRKLRIAFSAACLIACVLLIALWVRSYTWAESYYKDVGQIYCGGSLLRGVVVLHWLDASKCQNSDRGYTWGPAPGVRLDKTFPVHFYGFFFTKNTTGLSLVVPIWFLMVVSIGCAVAPWLSWRFSIRTLLIAMTLVAVVLGLIVVLSR
jgi:hypothetical protein